MSFEETVEKESKEDKPHKEWKTKCLPHAWWLNSCLSSIFPTISKFESFKGCLISTVAPSWLAYQPHPRKKKEKRKTKCLLTSFRVSKKQKVYILSQCLLGSNLTCHSLALFPQTTYLYIRTYNQMGNTCLDPTIQVRPPRWD